MLDSHSPLEGVAQFELSGISIVEDGDFQLWQYAGDEKELKKTLGKLPARVGAALEHDNRRVMRIGPKQIWAVGNEIPEATGIYKTNLSSGRCRLRMEGAKARDVLQACAIIDFHKSQFKPGQFAMTSIHHTPVTIHCIGENIFHVYALRSFSLAVWEWLVDAAKGLRDAQSA